MSGFRCLKHPHRNWRDYRQEEKSEDPDEPNCPHLPDRGSARPADCGPAQTEEKAAGKPFYGYAGWGILTFGALWGACKASRR